jgi:hypothetical protein
MQANNILSASRFGAYLKKHLVDNYRLYVMSLIVLTGLLLFALLFAVFAEPSIHTYTDLIPFFLIGLYVAGLIFTSKSFDELGNKSRGMDYLLLPASHLEKFLTTLLITTIGFLSVYHVAFFLAVKAGESILSLRNGTPLINDLAYNRQANGWYINYFIWFVAQAMFLLGTVYFQKYSLIKTVLCFFIFLTGMYLINAIFAQIFFQKYMRDWKQQFPFIGVNIFLPRNMEAHTVQYSMNFVMLELPKRAWKPLLYFFEYFVPPILWTVAYFKLRDKEI